MHLILLLFTKIAERDTIYCMEYIEVDFGDEVCGFRAMMQLGRN
jgi:hypothetical protein